MTLNQTWKKCIAAWKKIVEKYESTSQSVKELKEEFVSSEIVNRCYFCSYAEQIEELYPISCAHCPGKLVEKSFNCQKSEYNYLGKPRKFLEKLLELDEIRKETK